MKMKKLFLLLVLCAFSFSIFGCDLFQKEIIDGELLSSYLEKEERVSKKGFAPVGSASSFYPFSSSESLYGTYSGVIVTYNSSYDQYKVYSTITGSQIGSTIGNSGSYYVYTPVVGTFVKIVNSGYTTLYDAYGNLIYSNGGTHEFMFGRVWNENDDLILEVTVDGIQKSYYTYDMNGYLAPTSYNTGSLTVGSTVNNVQSLKNEYGLDLYWVVNHNTYVMYDENKEYNFTYTIPYEAEEITIIGEKLYYYLFNRLPEDAEKYDIYGENKENFKCYSVNLRTGKEKEEKLDYILWNSEFIYQEDNKSYYVVEIKTINKDKTIGVTEYWIADKKGNLKENVTNKFPEGIGGFVKVNDNFLDKNTGLLYNSELEIIASLGNSVKVLKDGYIQIYKNDVNDKYGIVNSNGVLVCPCEYQSISCVGSGYAVGQKGLKLYRIDLSNGYETLLENYLTTSVDNLFIIRNATSIQYINIDGTILATFYGSSSPNTYPIYTEGYYHNQFTNTYHYYIISRNVSSGSMEKLTTITYR